MNHLLLQENQKYKKRIKYYKNAKKNKRKIKEIQKKTKEKSKKYKKTKEKSKNTKKTKKKSKKYKKNKKKSKKTKKNKKKKKKKKKQKTKKKKKEKRATLTLQVHVLLPGQCRGFLCSRDSVKQSESFSGLSHPPKGNISIKAFLRPNPRVDSYPILPMTHWAKFKP